MKNLVLFTALIVVALAGCDTSQAPTPPQSGPASPLLKGYSDYTAEAYNIYNPCCDEWIAVHGSIHVTTEATTSSSGNIQRRTRINSRGLKMIGESGNEYVVQEQNEYTNLDYPNCPSSFTGILRSRYHGIGRDGHECSFILRLDFTYSYDDDCNLTITDLTPTIECE
jgi:hypothetical protein